MNLLQEKKMDILKVPYKVSGLKKLLLILLVIASYTVAGSDPGAGGSGWTAPATGFIDINVESNINRLNFSYSVRNIYLYDAARPGIVEAEKADIVVPVREFTCTNEIAYNDFLSLLKAEQYPDLTITIPQDVLVHYDLNEIVTINDVTINIAGISKEYDILCRVEKDFENRPVLAGTVTINLSELRIDPPVKYFGLIKIKDEVIVKFGFRLNDNSLAINNGSS